MVRKSVMIGFGLWLLAVFSVAAIAWLAIDTAARPVTALSVTATASPSDTAFTASPVPSSPAPDPTTPVTTPAETSSPARPATADEQASAPRAYFGIVSTEGGRVRAQCLNQKATLDGGYARPEPGWMVHVDSEPDQVKVFFGSQARVIAVMAQCSDGRPIFMQRSWPRSEGAPLLSPSPPVQSVAPPVTSPAIRPRPLVQSARTETTPPDASESAGQAPEDAAKVAAYVTAQDQMCSQSAGSPEPGALSAWCVRWNAMPVEERYQVVWRWLTWMEWAGSDSSRTDGRGWDSRPEPSSS